MNETRIEERELLFGDPPDPLRTIRALVSLPPGPGPHPLVLQMHGFKGFMRWGFHPELASRLAALGLAVVRFDFSGSGVGADGERFTEERAFFENTPSRELEDVERVRAWLDVGIEKHFDKRRVALLGHSLGGGVALVHAARRGDYSAVVGWASVATFRRFPPEVERLWRAQGYVEVPNLRTKEVHRMGLGWLEDLERNAAELDVPAACARLSTPTLLVHGEEDEAVPLSEARTLLAAFPPGVARLELVPHANHTFWAAHPLAGVAPALEHALSVTADFLAERLL